MIIFIFLIGLCLGSFLNVLIDRLPKGEQVVKGRSHCDFCHKKLKFFDLIPLLSFLFLKGQCHYCHKKISFYYPLVEFITAILFVFTFKFFSFPFFVVCYLLIVICCLIVIFFADLKYGIIPDEIVMVGILITIVYRLLYTCSYVNIVSLFPFDFAQGRHCFIVSLFPGIIAASFFFLLFLITKSKGMGLGDVKFAFLIGFLLGWPKTVVAIYTAFLTGAVIGVILILIGKKRFGQTIPFGPFLAMGTGVSLFFGEQILKWWQLFL